MKAKTIAYICNHKDGHVKLFMEAPASPMWEVSELVLRHEAQAENDALKAENEALHAECDRLTRYLGKVPNKDAEESYDKIDRYLRNNLDDSEYAAMSAALEHCYRTLLYSQKPMSAEEVTEPGFYWWRPIKKSQFEPVNVIKPKTAFSPLKMLMLEEEKEFPITGQFIGPIRMSEVSDA